MKKDSIGVVIQAFYGNKSYIELNEDVIDYMLQGTLYEEPGLDFEVDRTIVKIPDSKCVLIYNKYQEADQLKQNEELWQRDAFIAKPLATIPELGINIYSRCFICRISETGTLESIQKEDAVIVSKYLAPQE